MRDWRWYAMKSEELTKAIQQGDSKRVAALLDEDRALLKAKSGNVTAVLLAVYHGHPEIAQLFVEWGAELTFPEACAVGDEKRALELLKTGADPHARTDDGKSAADVAEKYSQPAFAEWFRANIK